MDDEIVRAAKAKKGSPFLSTAQAAHYVSLSRRTLDPFNHDGMSVAEARRSVEALKQKAVS